MQVKTQLNFLARYSCGVNKTTCFGLLGGLRVGQNSTSKELSLYFIQDTSRLRYA